ncbi:MAG: DUF4263 domain-containing protein [Gallionellaceae bacterium]
MKLTALANTPLEQRYPEDWPPLEYYIHESSLQPAVVLEFRALVEQNAGERALDRYITKHPVLLTALLDFKNTGNHAAWVVPKKAIRSKISTEVPGLIPDFLVGGKNSFGITWYVVELKGAEHPIFTNSGGGLSLSKQANRGLCQVLEYMNFCNTAQGYLRDTLKLHGFESAEAFLFIGRESETSEPQKRELKSAFNKINAHLQIRSYDALLRCCDRILGSNN